MPDRWWPEGAWAGEFADASGVRRAIDALTSAGCQRVEYYGPYPLPDAGERLHPQRSRLPLLTLIGGVVGGVASYAIQWYANAVAYPLDIGGRPGHAVAAFLVATFEGVVLGAGLAAFVGCLMALRLPALWHPMFELDGFERTGTDRFWVAVDTRDASALGEDVSAAFERLGALGVHRVEPSR